MRNDSRNRRHFRNTLAAGTILLACSCVAQADTVYTTQAAWNAAVSGVTTVNFEGIVAPGGFQGYAGNTTVGGVNFAVGPASPSGLLFVIGDTFYGFGVASISSQDPNTNANPTNDLLITLPSSVTAAAFDYIIDPGTMTITLSDAFSSQVTTSDTPTFGFFGVVSPGGITTLDLTLPFTAASESINVSDLSYATANDTSTPEPSSLLLMLAALGGILAMSHRRRSTARVASRG